MIPGAGPLVLASRSPRRAELLRRAGIPFEVRRFPPVDETPPPGLADPAAIAGALAERKARAAARRAPEAVLLAADTLVSVDGRLLGKPGGRAEAEAMLRALSGRTHEVVTGVAVARPDGRGGVSLRVGVARTRVRFRPLAPEAIRAYVASGEGLDKAGGYALQGRGWAFVQGLEGEADTVVGLPVGLVRELLEPEAPPGR